ncbi:MAG: hypothetical protein J5708_06350 [Bacteroidales bacterium]|nr:hypothetical protein [Bacteroidales bacterium]
MCSYNITPDDTLVQKAKPSFADDKALKKWLQQQMEEMLRNYVRHQNRTIINSEEQVAPDIVLSLLGAGTPIADSDLNGRNDYYHFLEEKYK